MCLFGGMRSDGSKLLPLLDESTAWLSCSSPPMNFNLQICIKAKNEKLPLVNLCELEFYSETHPVSTPIPLASFAACSEQRYFNGMVCYSHELLRIAIQDHRLMNPCTARPVSWLRLSIPIWKFSFLSWCGGSFISSGSLFCAWAASTQKCFGHMNHRKSI